MPAIRNWVVQQERDAGRREDGLSNDERQELSRLRRENKQLRIERDILKKAAAWFARESDSIPDQMQERHPELLEGCSRLSADKGYDDHKLINRLWDQHQIKPIIAIRNCWQDGEAEHDGVVTKLARGQQNVIYTYDGAVSCVCPQTGTLRSMDYGGFERDRNTLKYRCPARYSGATCKGIEQCPVGDAVRIRLDEDRRVFTPVARSSPVMCGRTTTTSAARWSGSTAAWRAGSGSSVRASAGWRRCGCASPWR